MELASLSSSTVPRQTVGVATRAHIGRPPTARPAVSPIRVSSTSASRTVRCEAQNDVFRIASPAEVAAFGRGSASFAPRRPVTAMGAMADPMMAPRLADMDPASILLSQRVIFLGTQVDDLSADLVISQLLLLDAQDPSQDIKLIINSPGGSVTAGMGIYDAMKLCRADVSTICFGLAASMGAFLLAAGSKGKRFCMPNSRVMIHQPLGGAQGSAIDVGLQVREMLYHKVKLNKILSRVTGKSEEQIEIDTDRDNFLSPWEAVEYGLVDAVLGADNPKVVAPVGEVREPPKTKVWDLWTVKEGKERKKLPGEGQLPR
eukprot:TRINITY_DN4759_c1_g1_i1.p1 TRINITY_DN4759_c1_g1~~TRINITY_DN4759_c1_g1_i1.p1  ORF type:complete len:353 (-),score=-7.93 TRINITY_DN4759_c1_g1_i1:26-976(-)